MIPVIPTEVAATGPNPRREGSVRPPRRSRGNNYMVRADVFPMLVSANAQHRGALEIRRRCCPWLSGKRISGIKSFWLLGFLFLLFLLTSKCGRLQG